MNRTIKKALCMGFLTVFVATPVSATLIDRGSGLIYDTVLDITWLQDAGMGGFRNWNDAVSWADTLMFGGFDDWRLPSMSVAGGLPPGQTFTPVDCSTATAVACRDNELGYMAFYNLGGTLGDNLTGDHALIMNVQFDHWSGTEFSDISAHDFFFRFTIMSSAFKDVNFLAAWAVRDGDVGAVGARVPIDIKPQSCPNPLNVKSKGLLPVALLGTADFDVSEIDPVSVRLAGVAPLRSNIEDVATPFAFPEKEDCNDCTDLGEDGFDDLTLKFDTQEIVSALGAVKDGDCLLLELTGNLQDGTPIVGEDVVLILKKGKKK